MTIQAFELLNEVEQEKIVFAKAVFIGNYVRGNNVCDVYQLADFYVRFCYLLSTHGNAIITASPDPGSLSFPKEIDRTDL